MILYPGPWSAGNLANTAKEELFHILNVRKGDVFLAGKGDKFRVGVVGAIDEPTARKVTSKLLSPMRRTSNSSKKKK